jgi:uncharacterized protein YjbI with pentapeptide repeats
MADSELTPEKGETQSATEAIGIKPDPTQRPSLWVRLMGNDPPLKSIIGLTGFILLLVGFADDRVRRWFAPIDANAKVDALDLTNENLEVRLRALQALRPLADTPAYRPAIYERLTLLVQVRADPSRLPGPCTSRVGDTTSARRIPRDVQEALTLIGVLNRHVPGAAADFKGTNLTDADLRGASLKGVNFSGACLADARLDGATLDSGRLNGATLSGASFKKASLRDAHLVNAQGSRVNFTGANLVGADLSLDTLPRASFRDAKLCFATLGNAMLDGSYFSDAIIAWASFEGTSLGAVHDWEEIQISHGALLSEARNFKESLRAWARAAGAVVDDKSDAIFKSVWQRNRNERRMTDSLCT